MGSAHIKSPDGCWRGSRRDALAVAGFRSERSDAFVALPGGIGTFEELFEIWTWRQLGYHDKPIGLLNVDGYYDGMLGFLGTSVQSGFMGDWQMSLISTDTDHDALLRKLVQEAGNNMSQIPLRTVI